MKPKLYISGPMTGIQNKNYSAFRSAAISLRKKGYKIVNPWELGQDNLSRWEDFIRRDLKAMLISCNGIATLKGWKKSRGANLEIHIAKALKWPVHSTKYWIKQRSL